MKKFKMPIKDSNGTQLYENDLVQVNGPDINLICKIQYLDKSHSEYWFLNNGAGYKFNQNKYKFIKIK